MPNASNDYAPLPGGDPYASAQTRIAVTDGEYHDTVEDSDVLPSYDESNRISAGTVLR